jgi:Histidine kinase/Tetratricopeptide repeat
VILASFSFIICPISFSQNSEVDSLRRLVDNSKPDTNRIVLINQLARRFSMHGYYDSGLVYSREAFALAEKFENRNGMGVAQLNLGYVFLNKSNFSEGVGYLYSALKYLEDIGGLSEISRIYQAIGYASVELGNMEEALKNLSKAASICDDIGEKAGVAQAYNSMGEVYRKQAKYSEALKYHFDALNICKLPGFDGPQWSLPYCYQSIAQVYQAQAELLKKSENRLLTRTKFNEALDFFNIALELWISADRNDAICEIYISMAEIHFHLEDHKKASDFVNKGLKLSLETKADDVTRQAYFNWYKLDSLQGKFQNAFEHYKSYIIYRDRIINDEVLKEAETYKIQYEFDKKEDSLHQKQIITQTKLDSQKNQKNFYLAGAGMLALLSVFVFLNFRNQKKINRLANDAHAKEKAELELQSLRAQLNPHFMFNSLNAIQELILLDENEKSQTYLARFAKLLRLLLENADKPFIPLQREIDFLQLYLSLENLRIPDLQFSINVDPDINTEETLIPNMILQPYIENAIWHGLSHKENDKQLRIRITNVNGFTKYEIEDNGVGRKRSAELKSLYRKEHKSKGMELLSKRFKLLAKEYGSDINTVVTDIDNGETINGTLIIIKVPIIYI